MCKLDSQIHLCSCASIAPIPYPVNKDFNKDNYLKTHFVWKLNRYLGEKDTGMTGEMVMPLQRLSEDLTIDKLITKLCKNDIFDFDYTPKEGDELIIREEYIYKAIKGKPRPELFNYMSLIYKDDCWEDDFYDIFSEKTRSFNKGIIKIK